jgi:hypothetical protein
MTPYQSTPPGSAPASGEPPAPAATAVVEAKSPKPLPVRRGFHRLGLVGLVPLVLAAGVALLYAAHTYTTGKDVPVYVATGPDGKRWEWKGDNASHSNAQQWLTSMYGTPIVFGSGGTSYPTRYHARSEAWDPAVFGLALLALGAIWYTFFWTVGWVISGFQREGE